VTPVGTQDSYIEDSGGTAVGQPETTAGAVISPTIAGAATFTSKWYARGSTSPNVFAAFYGSAALAADGLAIETSWDGTTVHNMYTASSAAKTLGGAARHVAEVETRVIARFWRVKVINAAGAQTGALLWAGTSSQKG
jgi:hypothetical protein